MIEFQRQINMINKWYLDTIVYNFKTLVCTAKLELSQLIWCLAILLPKDSLRKQILNIVMDEWFW